jgi:UDP-N-acetylglucosamine acyltransferase
VSIHPTAIISDEAEIAEDVYIGPYSVIIGKVKIGPGNRIENHVSIGSENGRVDIGEKNHFLQGCVVGAPPQDVSYSGEDTDLVIGSGNVIREFVTINKGTTKQDSVTLVGDDNLLMAYVHIAHDCHIKNRVAIANSTHFAGHVVVEDDVKIGGGCLFNQFITLGRHCYIAGDSAVNKDIPPFTIAQGNFAVVRASNKVGMDRSGFSKQEIQDINKAVRFLTKGGRTVEEAVARIREECQMSVPVKDFVHFIENSKKGLAL